MIQVVDAEFWAANHSDVDVQRLVCCPFDFTLAEDGRAQYGKDLVLQYLCFPRFGMKVRMYANHVVAFDSVEYHWASRPFALVEGGLRASVVLVSQKKYFTKDTYTNHYSGHANRKLPDLSRARGSVKKAKLSDEH